MRGVVTFIAIKLIAHLMINLLELAAVYAIARVLYLLLRRLYGCLCTLVVVSYFQLRAAGKNFAANTRKLLKTKTRIDEKLDGLPEVVG